MGRRSGYPEGDGSRLAKNDPGDVLEFTADLLDQRFARFSVRLSSLLPFAQKGFDTGGSRTDHSFGPAVKEPLLRSARAGPSDRDRFIVGEIGCRTRTERLDQSEGMANAREPRHGFRIGARRIGGCRLNGDRHPILLV